MGCDEMWKGVKMENIRVKRLNKRLLSVCIIITIFLATIQVNGVKVLAKENNSNIVKLVSNPESILDMDSPSGYNVTYSCIQFGSYPQSEILEDDSRYEDISAESIQWGAQNDVELDGYKYRRIVDSKGNYKYYIYEPIKWRVLNKTNSELLLLSDTILDYQMFSAKFNYVDWDKTTMRSWLNGKDASHNEAKKDYSTNNFINYAFNTEEQSIIKETTNIIQDKMYTDKVFLLTIDQIVDSYGFASKTAIKDKARRAKSTAYAQGLGLKVNKDGNSIWWVNESGTWSSERCVCDEYGYLEYYDNVPDYGWHLYGKNVTSYYGVRPAIKVNTKESLFNNNVKYAGTVCSNGIVNESGGKEEVPEKKSLIIEAVEKYATDNETLKKMLFHIQEQNLPYDVKMQLMNDICMQYGYTDVKEGIEYLNDASSAQIAYSALVNNEQYCSWNFGYYLNNTTKGKIARGLLYTDGLIFNEELGAWLEPGTYIENDYPGIKKYKTLLAKFIEDTSKDFEVYARANEVLKIAEDIIKINNKNDEEKLEKDLEKLINAKSGEEQEKIINEVFKNNKLIIVDDEYVTTKNEVWGKAFGVASKTLKIAFDGTKDILAFINVSTRMRLYQEYDLFFKDIINADDLPFELRAAAYFLREEVKSGYMEPIKDTLLHGLKNASALQDKLQVIKVEKGELVNLFKDITTTVEISTFIVNLLVDMGGLVKNAAYTNGYAYLTAFYANLLEESRANFNNNKTEANAWDFYYKYNILYRLRIAGEETYLALNELSPNGIMGWGGYLLKYAFDYDSKKSLVESNISFIKEHCKFQLPNAVTVPETYQFAQKAIISCPVDVKVYDSNGTVIAMIADGNASDISNEYGRFMSVYKPYSKDYAKVIYLKDDGNYTYQIIGKEKGTVSLQMFEDGDVASGFRNVALDENTIIKATTDNTVTTYEIDSNADGKTDKQEELQQEKDKIILLSSLSISDTECSLFVDEHKQLSYQYEPLNAVNSQISWKIEDTSVASITQNGEITALSVGTTTAYCISTSVDEKGDNIVASCNITVEDNIEDLPSETTAPPEVTNSPVPTAEALATPTAAPSTIPSVEQTATPTVAPLSTPSVEQIATSTVVPPITPSVEQIATPTVVPPTIPSVEQTVTPTVKPSVIPSLTPLPYPSLHPSPKPSNMPSVSYWPEFTSSPNAAQKPNITPCSTIVPTASPTEIPEFSLKPSESPYAIVGTATEKNNNSIQLKKGSKVTDKKTKAVYMILSKGKNKTVRYLQSTKKNPICVIIPNRVRLKGKAYKVISIGKGAFRESKKLKMIKIGKNVKTIGKKAFSECKRLINVTLGKNVIFIGANAFSKCIALPNITIPSKVKMIGSKAFYQCRNLRYIVVKTKKLTFKNVGNKSFSKGATRVQVKTNKNKWRRYVKIFTTKGMSGKALYRFAPAKKVKELEQIII